jgi:hypothetical protein
MSLEGAHQRALLWLRQAEDAPGALTRFAPAKFRNQAAYL